MAAAWLRGVLTVQGLLLGSIGAAFTDTVKSWIPSARVISDFVKAYPALTIALIGVGILGTVAASVVVWRDPAAVRGSRSAITNWLQKPVVSLGSISVASISSCLLVALIVLLVARPTWCPSQICAVGLAAYPGPNDGYIGVQVFAIQTDTILIPGDPAGYSLAHLPASSGPSTVAAVLVQQPNGTHAPAVIPYRVAARIQNLRSDMGSLSVEEVELVVKRISATSHVNAWRQGAVADYEQNPFVAAYASQGVGETIPALYAGAIVLGHVGLDPGESDVVTIRLWSSTPADIGFHVRITYRFLNATSTRAFEDPQGLEVLFATELQWTQYQLTGGKFQPA